MKHFFSLIILLSVLGFGMHAASAQIVQEPVPTEPPVEQISPALRNLSDALPWETLAMTLFTRKKFHDDEYDMDYFIEMPEFPEAVRALDGTEVTIKGHMITYHNDGENGDHEKEENEGHKIFLLTGTPESGCGHYHGPGSLVVEIYAKEPAKATQGILAYKGTLELVPGDEKAYGIFYRLNNAVPAP